MTNLPIPMERFDPGEDLRDILRLTLLRDEWNPIDNSALYAAKRSIEIGVDFKGTFASENPRRVDSVCVDLKRFALDHHAYLLMGYDLLPHKTPDGYERIRLVFEKKLFRASRCPNGMTEADKRRGDDDRMNKFVFGE